MRAEEWRALIAAYVEGRLSADAFRRRFLEAFAAAARVRMGVPPAVQELAFVVDAYAGDPMARGHDVADDAQLMAAAQGALVRLGPAEAPQGAPTITEVDPEEVKAQVRRAAFTFGAVGAVGCLLGLAWLAISVLQFFAASAQVDAVLGWGPAPSTIIGLVLAFVPILGSVVAFFGAVDVWKWPLWAAGVVFFAIPALTMTMGFLRWREQRRVEGRMGGPPRWR